MPRLVGNKITGVVRISDNATPATASQEAGIPLVRLTYSQVVRLPPSEIRASLDTTDRGGPHTYAKRWYRWFAPIALVLIHPKATPNMVCRAQTQAQKKPDHYPATT